MPQFPDVSKSTALYARAGEIIPGRVQLISRRADQFANGVSPVYAQRAKGSRFIDVDENEPSDSAVGVMISVCSSASSCDRPMNVQRSSYQIASAQSALPIRSAASSQRGSPIGMVFIVDASLSVRSLVRWPLALELYRSLLTEHNRQQSQAANTTPPHSDRPQ